MRLIIKSLSTARWLPPAWLQERCLHWAVFTNYDLQKLLCSVLYAYKPTLQRQEYANQTRNKHGKVTTSPWHTQCSAAPAHVSAAAREPFQKSREKRPPRDRSPFSHLPCTRLKCFVVFISKNTAGRCIVSTTDIWCYLRQTQLPCVHTHLIKNLKNHLET